MTILWLQSPSVVILEPKKIKSVTSSTFPSSICHEVVGPDTMILVFMFFFSFVVVFFFFLQFFFFIFYFFTLQYCIGFAIH